MPTAGRAGTRVLHLVVPGGIDDPGSPSGGNTYDRRIRDGLRALGWTVHQHPVAGTWPTPAVDHRAALARVLEALPDEGSVLVDGLVGCGVPEVLAPRAGRLVVLVHLPLGDEVGAAPDLAERERVALHAARAVVVTSPWAARRVLEVHALPPDRVHVVRPGTDPAAPPPASPAIRVGESRNLCRRVPQPVSASPAIRAEPATGAGRRLLCVGALTPTKGQDVLVEALALVRNRVWSCDLVGPPRNPRFVADLGRALARHGLRDRIRLLGPLPAENRYPDVDLLVLPSRAETYGMVITEALARGVPVIASEVGGVPETLGRAPDGARPGLLVPAADPEALASTLRRWFDDGGLRTELRTAAARRRETLDGWEVTARCLADVLTRLR